MLWWIVQLYDYFSNHEFQPQASIPCVPFDTGMGDKVERCVDHLESAFWMGSFVAVIAWFCVYFLCSFVPKIGFGLSIYQ